MILKKQRNPLKQKILILTCLNFLIQIKIMKYLFKNSLTTQEILMKLKQHQGNKIGKKVQSSPSRSTTKTQIITQPNKNLNILLNKCMLLHLKMENSIENSLMRKSKDSQKKCKKKWRQKCDVKAIEINKAYIKIYQMKGKNSQVCYSQQSNHNNSHLQFEETCSHKDNALQKQSLTNKKLKAEMEIWSQDNIHKLPINLFHSSAQYNKMLITNGRSLQKNSQPQIDGFIDNLEFVNDQIFQSQEQKQGEKRRQSHLSSDRKKQTNSMTQECNCCCCDNYCVICAKSGSQRKNPLMRKSVAISQKIISSSIKRKKMKNKNKKVITSKKMNIIDKGKSEKDMSSNSYLSHKTYNIDHLICKSLISFEEEKRENKLKKVVNFQKQNEKRGLLSKLNEEIRQKNKESVSKNKSEVSLKSDKTKPQIRMNYWSSIKDKINQELKNSKIDKLSVFKKDYVQCHHKPKISPEKIEALKQKYEKEAKEKISKEIRDKKVKEKKLNKDLKKLNKERMEIVEKCYKKQFKPSQQMIENAFTNLT